MFLLLFVLAYYTGFLRENCGTDAGCFVERAVSCKPTDVFVLRDTNVYEYSIRGSVGDCSLHVTLDRVAAGAAPDVEVLVGKKMICSIPKEDMKTFTLDTFEGYLQYCHGELKEGLLELVLRRVYGNLVGQLGDVLTKIQ